MVQTRKTMDIYERAMDFAAEINHETDREVDVTEIPSHVVVFISKKPKPAGGWAGDAMADYSPPDALRAHLAANPLSVCHVPKARSWAMRAALDFAGANPNSLVRVVVPHYHEIWAFGISLRSIIVNSRVLHEEDDASNPRLIILSNGARIVVEETCKMGGAEDFACGLLVVDSFSQFSATDATELWAALEPSMEEAGRIAVFGGGPIPPEGAEAREHGFYRLLLNEGSKFVTFMWDWDSERHGDIEAVSPMGDVRSAADVKFDRLRGHIHGNRHSSCFIEEDEIGMVAALILELAAGRASIMVAAPNMQKGIEFIGKIKEINEMRSFFSSAPRDWRQLDIQHADDRKIRFSNGARITAIAVTEDNPEPFEGMNVDCILLHEFDQAAEDGAVMFAEYLKAMLMDPLCQTKCIATSTAGAPGESRPMATLEAREGEPERIHFAQFVSAGREAS